MFGPFLSSVGNAFKNANVFSGIDEDKRTGTLGVRCKTHDSKMFLYLFVYLLSLIYFLFESIQPEEVDQ